MTAELIVERTAHLETLGEALACAERRRGRCILLAGEAGSGKSALVGRFLDGLPRRVDVVSATCQDMSTPLPLAPLYDIARALGGAVQEAVRNGADHRALFETLLEQMTEARHPTVMVLEDVHWADEASLDLLRFLIRRLAGVPLLALVTFRDVEIGEQLQRLLGELAAAPDVRRLGVAALSLDGVAALAPGADPRYIAEIHRRSGGNAFFVRELLSQADRSAVPMTVQDAVLPRLSRLDPATRAAAELAAVVGDPAEITLLERLGCAAADIDECLGSGFLIDRGAGRVGFRHDIVRETVAAAIPAARRRALHAGILAAFDDRTHPARLVEHAVAAGDSAAITRWAPIAAERAQDVGAIRQAAELLRLAIEAGTEHDALAELARRRGLLLGDLGEFEVALRVLETGLALVRDEVVRAELLAVRARTHAMYLQGEDAERWLAAALAAAEALPEAVRPITPYMMMLNLALLQRDQSAAIPPAAMVARIAEHRGDRVAAVEARVVLASVSMTDPGGLDELRAATKAAEDLGAMRVALRGRNNLADGLFALGQLPDAVEEIERAIALCAEQDYDDSLGRLILSKLVYLLEMARFDEVIAACQALVADPAHEWRGGPPGLLAVALTRTGRPGWEPHLRRELEIAVASPDLVLRVYSRLCDAEIKWLHDDPSWLPVLMGVYDALDVRFGWFRTMVAGWVRLLGGPELSIDPGPGPWELVVAGEWADAAALWRSRNQPYHEALTRLRLDDVQHVQEAHRLLVELDARPVAARAARRLRELNVAPRPGRGYARTTRANPAGLTAREVDVLRLVAEGLRNAEVADRLVLSPRTIDHHVSSVLRKLGVQSRSAAGRAAHALGLVDAVAS